MCRIFISPEFKGALTASDLLQIRGTVTFVLSLDNIRDLDIIFCDLYADGFRFKLELKNGRIHLERGTESVTVTPILEGTALKRRVFVRWDPNLLIINCGTSKDDEVVDVAESPGIAFPPMSLIRFARHQKLIPSEEFQDVETFRNAVYELTANLQDDIERLGTYNPFWDQTYDGRKKEVPTPKRETDIHPTLNLLFSEWAFLRSVEVIPENQTGAGNLDFCFVGHVTGEGPTSICVEVKKAQAKDIVHGLEVQLPTYMERKRAQYGAYLVMWFKGEWVDKPDLSVIQQISRSGIADSDSLPTRAGLENLEFALNGILLANPRLQNIRPFIIDVSKPIVASKA